MPITRTPILDDDGTGTTGTVIDNAWKQEFYDQIDAGLSVVDPAKTGTSITDRNPPAGTTTITGLVPAQIRIVNMTGTGGEVTVTSATPGAWGDLLIVQNVGFYPLKFQYGNGSGLFYNRFTTGPTPIGPLGSVTYVCQLDGRWFLAQHDQGAAIAVPYVAGNFTATGGGSWTVSSGQQTCTYLLTGNVAHLHIFIESSSFTGAGDSLLVGGWPFMFAVASTPLTCLAYPPSGWNTAMVYANQGINAVRFMRLTLAAWGSGSGTGIFNFDGQLVVT